MGQHFVLLHGAWHGGWCWEGVIEELEKRGRTAEAPTMPVHNPDDNRANIQFEDYLNMILAVHNRQKTPWRKRKGSPLIGLFLVGLSQRLIFFQVF